MISDVKVTALDGMLWMLDGMEDKVGLYIYLNPHMSPADLFLYIMETSILD